MAIDGSERPEPAAKAEGIEIKDLPCSEEELTATQAESVTGGATVATTGAGVCWLAASPQLDSCWIENNGKLAIRNP